MENKNNIWVADLGDGTYRNPILYADYSDPDAIRVGDDYFMVASSFCNTPALPLLHSKDLVNWKVVNYILDKIPYPDYDSPAHGRGVWAPALRYHNHQFWVCFPMPDEGLFFCTADDPFGKWSEPIPLRLGSGWIDPCPFWDDDGKAYVVSGFAKSRIGFKSILNMAEMKPDGTGLVDDGKHIYDGHNTQPTIEGPKLYKRNGYYYILAPAGGVKHGWQTALRSKNIWGPYEEKIVLFRGGTDINGPHQGALVSTQTGEDWFLHFQDVGTCGRIVHLQPVEWIDGWPVIGDNSAKENCGTPVLLHKKPNVGNEYAIATPDDSDEFDKNKLSLQWQWNANHKESWYAIADSKITLFTQRATRRLCDLPSLLLQKFPAPKFNALTKLDISKMNCGDTAGLVILGGIYGAAAIEKMAGGVQIVHLQGDMKTEAEIRTICAKANITGEIYLQASIDENSECRLSYGICKEQMISVGSFITREGQWVGAKLGLFCSGSNETGSVSADWFRISPFSESIQQSHTDI